VEALELTFITFKVLDKDKAEVVGVSGGKKGFNPRSTLTSRGQTINKKDLKGMLKDFVDEWKDAVKSTKRFLPKGVSLGQVNRILALAKKEIDQLKALSRLKKR